MSNQHHQDGTCWNVTMICWGKTYFGIGLVGVCLFVSQQERVGQGHLWNMLADGSILSIAGLEDYRGLVPTILWGSSRVWFTPPGPGLWPPFFLCTPSEYRSPDFCSELGAVYTYPRPRSWQKSDHRVICLRNSKFNPFPVIEENCPQCLTGTCNHPAQSSKSIQFCHAALVSFTKPP